MNKFKIVKTTIYNTDGEIEFQDYYILVYRSFLGMGWYEELTELNFYFGVYVQQKMRFKDYKSTMKYISKLIRR